MQYRRNRHRRVFQATQIKINGSLVIHAKPPSLKIDRIKINRIREYNTLFFVRKVSKKRIRRNDPNLTQFSTLMVELHQPKYISVAKPVF